MRRINGSHGDDDETAKVAPPGAHARPADATLALAATSVRLTEEPYQIQRLSRDKIIIGPQRLRSAEVCLGHAQFG
jgi:hypothetical protein